MVYQIDDVVMYGIHGVCRIVGMESRTVDRKMTEYLVLEPQGQPGSRYLVPSGNPNAMAKLRPVMSRQELEALLSSQEVRQDSWIADENQRKQHYRELISGGDRTALLRMIRTLHRHKKELAAAGRKFHICDDTFLRDAQRLIDTEFSVILGIQPSEVADYVLNKMNA